MWGKALLTAALFVGSLTPAAHADDADLLFMAWLIGKQLYVQSSGDQAVKEAKAACLLLRQGHSLQFVARGLAETEPNYSMLDAAKFIGAASNQYCPEQTFD